LALLDPFFIDSLIGKTTAKRGVREEIETAVIIANTFPLHKSKAAAT
jgi:hypothetical protein